MARDWLALYTATLGKPKYRRLSIPGRAALLHVWLLAPAQRPEATWRSRAGLLDLLELDGYGPEHLDELIARGWLDVEADGVVGVHDWDEHQYGATKAIRDYWEADRKRKWRRDRQSPPAPPSTGTGTATTTGTEQGPDIVRTRPDADDPVREGTADRTTCPTCGDALERTDPNVVEGPRRQLWHRECPTISLGKASLDELAAGMTLPTSRTAA